MESSQKAGRRNSRAQKDYVIKDSNENGYSGTSQDGIKREDKKREELDDSQRSGDFIDPFLIQNMPNVGNLSIHEGSPLSDDSVEEMKKGILGPLNGAGGKKGRVTSDQMDNDPIHDIQSTTQTINHTKILDGLNESQIPPQSQSLGFNWQPQPASNREYQYLNPSQFVPGSNQQGYSQVHPQSTETQYYTQPQANPPSYQQPGNLPLDLTAIVQTLSKMYPLEQVIQILLQLLSQQNQPNSQTNTNQSHPLLSSNPNQKATLFDQQATSFDPQQSNITQQQVYNPQPQQKIPQNLQFSHSNAEYPTNNTLPNRINPSTAGGEVQKRTSNSDQQSEQDLGVIPYQKRRQSIEDEDEEEEKFDRRGIPYHYHDEDQQEKKSRAEKFGRRHQEPQEQRSGNNQYSQKNQSFENSKPRIIQNNISSTEKEELRRYLNYARMICVTPECNVRECKDIHTTSICENLENCEDDCKKAHFSDLVCTLITTKQFTQNELLGYLPDEECSIYGTLNYNVVADKLYNTIDEKRKQSKNIQSDNQGEESAEARTKLSEQIQAIKEKIQQIELIYENYLKSVGKIIFRYLRDFRGNLESILEDIKTESACAKKQLPIYSKKLDIMKFLENPDQQFMVLSGETGSGKSTQLPIYILQHLHSDPHLAPAAIVQPRKISATALAARVRKELSEKMATFVGYDVGNKKIDKDYSNETKIIFMTDNRLIEEMIEDPMLSKFSFVLVDEAHERTIPSDTILGILKLRLCKERVRKNLKVIVASATIDVKKFASYLNNAKELEITGRQFPITYRYQPITTYQYDQMQEVKQCITRILVQKGQVLQDRTKFYKKDPNLSVDTDVLTGHILVFLPSLGDMEKLKALLLQERHQNQSEAMHSFKIVKFHAKMHPQKYDEVFENIDPRKKTKIILASKIAETSLTFDELSIIIDTGIDRDSYYNPLRGFDEVRHEHISKSAAKQRAGRAGRTRPGICYRLYSKEVYDYKFVNSKVPDFLKSNIEQPILILKLLKIDKIEDFELLDMIPKKNIENAESNLIDYRALDKNKKITDIGKKMSEITNEPFFSRPLFRAIKVGVFPEVAKIIAMLRHASSLFIWGNQQETLKSQQQALWSQLSKKYGFADAEGDHMFYLVLFEEFLHLHNPDLDSNLKNSTGLLDDPAKAWCSSNMLVYHVLKRVYETYEGLEKTFRKELNATKPEKSDQSQANLILECLLKTHIINICKYSGDASLGYILTREKNKFENMHLHSNSLYAGKEKDTHWIFFSELHDFGHLIAYSVTRLTESQLNLFTRFTKFKARIQEIKEAITQEKLSIIKVGKCGTSFLKRFEDKMTELSQWRLDNRVLYKIHNRTGDINLWNRTSDERTKTELITEFKKLKSDLERERLEIEIKGFAGVVIKKGPEIVDLLSNQETVTLVANDLKNEIKTSDLEDAINDKLGGDGLHQVIVNTDQQTYRKTATVVLSDKKYLNKLLNKTIQVRDQTIELTRQDFTEWTDLNKSVKIQVTWFRGNPKGNGAIFFGNSNEGSYIARKLNNSILFNKRIRATIHSNQVRLDDLPQAIDEIELREILEQKIPEAVYNQCCVYRSFYASDSDYEQEHEQVFQFVESKAKVCGGKYSYTTSFKSKCTYHFIFTNFDDANKFITTTDKTRTPVSISDHKSIEKMIHARPWRINPDYSIFKECYKAFEVVFESIAKDLNGKYKGLAKIVLPNAKNLQDGRPFVRIRIEPVTPISDIKQLNEKTSEIRQILGQIALPTEITSLNEHEFYSLLFSNAQETQRFKKINEEFNVFISATQRTRTLMIYGNPEDVKKAEMAIKDDLDGNKEDYIKDELKIVDRDATILTYKGITHLQRQYPMVYLNLKLAKGSLSLEFIGPKEDVKEAKSQIDQRIKPADQDNRLTCSICNGHLKDPRILHCGHMYCFRCIKQYLVDLCKKRDTKWLCFRADCNKEIIVRDITEILPLDELTSYLRQVLTKIYLKQPECKYIQCLCGQVVDKKDVQKNGKTIVCDHYTPE